MKSLAKIARRASLLTLFGVSAMWASAAQVDVTVTEAGTLSSKITSEDKYTITDLKISGPLNGTDLKFIREMAGIDAMWKVTDGKLVSLDLTDATMVSGGDPYACAKGTELNPIWMNARDDAMPENLFMMSILETIKLPTKIKGIYSTFNKAYNLKGDIVVPEGIQFLGEWAFAGTAISHIKLPDSLCDGDDKYNFNRSAIGSNAFNGCTKLESIEFPAGVTLLKGSAFFGCTGLTEVTIPSTLVEINSEAFGNCINIMTMNVESATPPKAGYNAFAGMDYENCVVNVPANSAMKFRNTEEWMEFAQIREKGATTINFTISTDADDFSGLTVRLDGKVMTIDGKSASFEAYEASRVSLSPLGSYAIDKVTATGATVNNLGDGTYRVVLTTDGAKINVSYSILKVKVETMPTYIDGVKVGDLKIKYNDALASEMDVTVGDTVEFVPEVLDDEYRFEYVTHVYDGSSDKDDYGKMTYTAYEWDVDDTMVFKGVFVSKTKLDGVEANESSMRVDGEQLLTNGTLTRVYTASGVEVLASTSQAINIANLEKGVYVARCGNETLKFVR